MMRLDSSIRLAGLILFILELGLPNSARSDPNEHGALLLHARPDLSYTRVANPQGFSGIADCTNPTLTVPWTDDTVLWFILASFPPQVIVDVTSAEFGIHYDPSKIHVVDYGFKDHRDVSLNQNYPEPGGTAQIFFRETHQSNFFEVAWFAGSGEKDSPALFEIGDTHTGSPAFWSGTRRQRVEFLGSLGFSTEGEFVCNPVIACCSPDGTCRVVPEFECRGNGTIQLDSGCEPNPCLEIEGACCPSEGEECAVIQLGECQAGSQEFLGYGSECGLAWGTRCDRVFCCIDGSECVLLRAYECLASHGLWDPEWATDEDCFHECCCPPTKNRSWGQIKGRFRSQSSRE